MKISKILSDWWMDYVGVTKEDPKLEGLTKEQREEWYKKKDKNANIWVPTTIKSSLSPIAYASLKRGLKNGTINPEWINNANKEELQIIIDKLEGTTYLDKIELRVLMDNSRYDILYKHGQMKQITTTLKGLIWLWENTDKKLIVSKYGHLTDQLPEDYRQEARQIVKKLEDAYYHKLLKKLGEG